MMLRLKSGVHLEEPVAMVRGAFVAPAHGVTRSQIRLDPELRHIDTVVSGDKR
jgi:hypothetical protein